MISLISRQPNFIKFEHNTSIGVAMKTFGTDRKGSFFQKTLTLFKKF